MSTLKTQLVKKQLILLGVSHVHKLTFWKLKSDENYTDANIALKEIIFHLCLALCCIKDESCNERFYRLRYFQTIADFTMGTRIIICLSMHITQTVQDL